MNKSVMIVPILIFGCATGSETYLPDGSKGYKISCDGSANSMASCYQHAGELCGEQGYTILGQNGEASPYVYSAGGASATPTYGQAGYTTQAGMFVSRSLFVRCKTQNK